MRLLKIGRDASNDIVLNSGKVSSYHAEITILDSGDILLEDRGSRNGTFVMNNPVQPGHAVTITRGDAVRFGDMELQWSQVPLPEDNSAYTGIWGVGSNLHNEIQISGATVSRYHATIKKGKDGKMYIIDHSKNGTTVDGVKIPSKQLYMIRKNSAVVCGGVPVNLSTLPWPGGGPIKAILAAAAVVLILAGAGIAAWQMGIFKTRMSSTDISEKYTTSTVMLIGMYHFEVTCGDLKPEVLNRLGIPTKFYYVNGDLKAFTDDADASNVKDATSYSASGFFVSEDGMVMTNLHVAKPWLFDGIQEKVESLCKRKLAEQAGILLRYGYSGALNAYISQLKVTGVSDGIMLIPQGTFYSPATAIKCHIVSASEKTDNDVALIQSDKCELPNKCTYIDIAGKGIEVDPVASGEKVVTIGFPHGMDLQNSKQKLTPFTHEGAVSQATPNEYTFTFSATAAQGASGSPVFNEYGQLVGILTAGVDKENILKAVKAQYIQEQFNAPRHEK